jgi:long-chain acyl-CoA synthetase
MNGARPWHRWYPASAASDYTPPSRTVSEMFVGLLGRYRDRVAIVFRDDGITYAQIGRQAARFAHALRRDGLAKGDRVALHLPNGPHHPAAFFGTLLAGGVVVHVSALEAVEEVRHKLADSGARILVTMADGAMAVTAAKLIEAGVVDLVVACLDRGSERELPIGAVSWDAFTAGCADTPVAAPVAPDDLALLQYTGGTTGRPKAAMVTHANLTAAAGIYQRWFAAENGNGADEVVLVVAPLSHIMALSSSLLRRFNEGARLILHERFDPARVIADIARYRVTMLGGVPTMWIALCNELERTGGDLSSLGYLSSGGAPLPPEVYHRVRRVTGHMLRGGWGMTETCSAGTNVPPRLPAEKAGTIGVPMTGVDMDVVALDDPRRVLAQGEVGELRVRGANVVKGYWRRSQESAAAFVDGWLLTGDIGFIDELGLIHIVDRKSDMIISSGFNIYPQVVENAVLTHPAVAEAMVAGMPDDYRGEAVAAFVVLRAGAEPFTLEQLRAHLADKLGRHELPVALEVRASLPRTSVGKYARRLLRERPG